MARDGTVAEEGDEGDVALPLDPESQAEKDTMQHLIDNPGQSVLWAPSLNAFVVKGKGTKKNTIFTVRHKAKRRGWASHRKEVEIQLRRARAFVNSGEMVPNPPIDGNDVLE